MLTSQIARAHPGPSEAALRWVVHRDRQTRQAAISLYAEGWPMSEALRVAVEQKTTVLWQIGPIGALADYSSDSAAPPSKRPEVVPETLDAAAKAPLTEDACCAAWNAGQFVKKQKDCPHQKLRRCSFPRSNSSVCGAWQHTKAKHPAGKVQQGQLPRAREGSTENSVTVQEPPACNLELRAAVGCGCHGSGKQQDLVRPQKSESILEDCTSLLNLLDGLNDVAAPATSTADFTLTKSSSVSCCFRNSRKCLLCSGASGVNSRGSFVLYFCKKDHLAVAKHLQEEALPNLFFRQCRTAYLEAALCEL